eukprot:scaffold154875_cov30-Tisochrysis_lutea.AAC.3
MQLRTHRAPADSPFFWVAAGSQPALQKWPRLVLSVPESRPRAAATHLAWTDAVGLEMQGGGQLAGCGGL